MQNGCRSAHGTTAVTVKAATEGGRGTPHTTAHTREERGAGRLLRGLCTGSSGEGSLPLVGVRPQDARRRHVDATPHRPPHTVLLRPHVSRPIQPETPARQTGRSGRRWRTAAFVGGVCTRKRPGVLAFGGSCGRLEATAVVGGRCGSCRPSGECHAPSPFGRFVGSGLVSTRPIPLERCSRLGHRVVAGNRAPTT